MAASPVQYPRPSLSQWPVDHPPLPTPPGPVNPLGTPDHDHIYSPAHPYRIPLSRPEYPPGPSLLVEERPAAIKQGLLLFTSANPDTFCVVLESLY